MTEHMINLASLQRRVAAIGSVSEIEILTFVADELPA